jgi:hypothetical protein
MKYLLTIILLISINSYSCENKITSDFDSPQSLRYRIDAIMNYSDKDGIVCIKRLPKEDYVDILIIHPKKLIVLGMARKSTSNIINGDATLGPDDVARNILCNNTCSNDLFDLLEENPDFILLSKEIREVFEKLEPPSKLITFKFKNNADKLLKHLNKELKK